MALKWGEVEKAKFIFLKPIQSPMAVVSINRKHTFSFPHKRRFSKKPVSSSNSKISRNSTSPATKFHTRCRGFLRFKLLVRASTLKKKTKLNDCCNNNEEINRETSNLIGLHEKDSQVVEEHCSNWGVRNGKNGNNLRVSLLRQVEVSNEPFIPLKEDEVAQVKSAFSPKNRMKVLVSHENSNIDIRGETLQCLMSTRWLNDEVINLYLELLKERETRDPQKYFKCHFFNTFFYVKLVSGSGYNYEAVRRWTTQRKLGYELIDCDIIFVPIHGSLHWTLAVINIREHKFMYLDSLNGVNCKTLKALAKYLMDEVKNKSGKNIDVSSWDFEFVKDLPLQQNGYDCGMFMLKYIDFYSRGLRLQFTQVKNSKGDIEIASPLKLPVLDDIRLLFYNANNVIELKTRRVSTWSWLLLGVTGSFSVRMIMDSSLISQLRVEVQNSKS